MISPPNSFSQNTTIDNNSLSTQFHHFHLQQLAELLDLAEDVANAISSVTQHRCGRQIVADVVEGLDTRRPFHVGMARENEDSKWLRLRRKNAGGECGKEEC
ncbi:hypothetical protein Poly41_31240 [Novipirellula artificiosorum]|uniref:Uncharacterized protein n=1 Tax=Novipirellula artificiosorum TaxID=2528016 RepID=A0A5C6DRZ5_9BACT|nr:hypothetical protein Poly41_31240 [Novipirellula artificiosorum]